MSNVMVPDGEYEMEVIDPMEHMFDNNMKKIDSIPATSSASAGTVTLHRGAGSLHPPSSLESREHSIIRQVDETYLTENILVMRLKKDIDELKDKKIVELEELLELESKKEVARAELESIKTDIAKYQTFFSLLKQLYDQTAPKEREREAVATAASDPSIHPRAASSSSSTSTLAQPHLPDPVYHDGQPRPAAGAKTKSYHHPAQLVPASAWVSPVMAHKSSEAVQQRPVESCVQQQRQQQLHTRPQLHPHPHPLQHPQQLRQHNIPAMAQQLLLQHRQKAATLSSPLSQSMLQVAPGPSNYRGPATLPQLSSGPSSVVPLPGQSPVQTVSVPAEVRMSASGSLISLASSASCHYPTSPDPSQAPPPVIIRPRAFCREVPSEPSTAKRRSPAQEVR